MSATFFRGGLEKFSPGGAQGWGGGAKSFLGVAWTPVPTMNCLHELTRDVGL